MGIPGLYRWLKRRYPKCVYDFIPSRNGNHLQGRANVFGTIPAVHAAQQQNTFGTNGKERFDCLYVDLNGIIHPCAHPEDRSSSSGNTQPTSESEIYRNVSDAIVALVDTVMPSKLLYLAIDGVAPRAKMNQQRSRRFASHGKENKDNNMNIDNDAQHDISMIEGGDLLNQTSSTATNSPFKFDVNSISPGTQFMHSLCKYILNFIQEKQRQRDSYWSSIDVIFSDCYVPGEGEHKIMEFIRSQSYYNLVSPKSKQQQQEKLTKDGIVVEDEKILNNPFSTHVICGMDADLVMLSLASREENIYVLREKHQQQPRQQSKVVDSDNNSSNVDSMYNRSAATKSDDHLSGRNNNKIIVNDAHSILSNFYKRAADISPSQQNSNKYRSITYELIDIKMMKAYLSFDMKPAVIDDNNFATGNNVNVLSNPTTPTTSQQSAPHKRHIKYWNENNIADDFILMSFIVGNDFLPALKNLEVGDDAIDITIHVYRRCIEDLDGHLILERTGNTRVICWPNLFLFLKRLDAFLESSKRRNNNNNRPNYHQSIDLTNEDASTTTDDEYYARRFPNFSREDVVKSYFRTISWNFQYYNSGIPSWTWFYPHHYPPLLKDICSIITIGKDNIRGINRELSFFGNCFGRPLLPFEQLVAIMPPSSSSLLPEAFNYLMSENASPPSIFAKYRVQLPDEDAHVKKRRSYHDDEKIILPFIDESELIEHVGPILKSLDEIGDECLSRNGIGNNIIFLVVVVNSGGVENETVNINTDLEKSCIGDITILENNVTVVKSEVVGVKVSTYHHRYTCLFTTNQLIYPVSRRNKTITNSSSRIMVNGGDLLNADDKSDLRVRDEKYLHKNKNIWKRGGGRQDAINAGGRGNTAQFRTNPLGNHHHNGVRDTGTEFSSNSKRQQTRTNNNVHHQQNRGATQPSWIRTYSNAPKNITSSQYNKHAHPPQTSRHIAASAAADSSMFDKSRKISGPSPMPSHHKQAAEFTSPNSSSSASISTTLFGKKRC